MAYAVQVRTEFERPGVDQSIEPAWWNYKELLGDLNFSRKRIYGSINYMCELNKETFIDVFLDQMKYLDKGVYALGDWKKVNANTMNKLSRFIEGLGELDKVELIIYEWES